MRFLRAVCAVITTLQTFPSSYTQSSNTRNSFIAGNKSQLFVRISQKSEHFGILADFHGNRFHGNMEIRKLSIF